MLEEDFSDGVTDPGLLGKLHNILMYGKLGLRRMMKR